ncbi:MAG: hypothetical protein ACLP7Q_00245 [Isosphaeraceae bacterium]
MGRVALVLHERMGNWAAQLRPRLAGRPVRWFETRSAADLRKILPGLGRPVVLLDLGSRVLEALGDLDQVVNLAPGARVLVLDPAARQEVPELARELGATHFLAGFVPPPAVANLIDRWIGLAVEEQAREGWSRPLPVDSLLDPEGWLDDILGDSAGTPA